jgi:hypothetical protein
VGVNVTYDGSTTPPAAPGSYTVVATVTAPYYDGTATGTEVVSPVTSKGKKCGLGTGFAIFGLFGFGLFLLMGSRRR